MAQLYYVRFKDKSDILKSKTNVLRSKEAFDRFLKLNEEIGKWSGDLIEIEEQGLVRDVVIEDAELAKMERRFELQTKQEKLEQELKKVKFELQKIESEEKENTEKEKETVFDE